MKNTKEKIIDNWEIRYNNIPERFFTRNDIKAFIRAELKTQKQEIVGEIEKIIKKEIVATRGRGWSTARHYFDDLIIKIKQTLTP